MTTLIRISKPSRDMKKLGAEVVFIREDENGREYLILGCKCHESWEQWGAPTEVLSENVEAIEKWRNP